MPPSPVKLEVTPSHNQVLAPQQPDTLQPLLDHMASNIERKVNVLRAQDRPFTVLDPDWCRANPVIAGNLHAQLIVETYGHTYALPNKDPEANRKAIVEDGLNVYVMFVDNKPAATACMIDTHDGRAELGRAAGKGGTGGGILLDARILDWLTNPETASKYHTLFATLRTAPDRFIDENGDSFVMRGGQAITSHWSKFPGLRVAGMGPLYLKHGQLEQFAIASLTRGEDLPNVPLFVDPQDASFIRSWHHEYNIDAPPFMLPSAAGTPAHATFEAHYPPKESGITDYVHADIVLSDDPRAKGIQAAVFEAAKSGTPFTQVVVPIDRNTLPVQRYLRDQGFTVFGYQNATTDTSPALMFGKITGNTPVVPTAWAHEGRPNPFWQSLVLRQHENDIVSQWQ